MFEGLLYSEKFNDLGLIINTGINTGGPTWHKMPTQAPPPDVSYNKSFF